MNRQLLSALLILFVLTLSVGASQQPSETNDLHKLEDYLRYASLNNAELKVKFEQWKVALEDSSGKSVRRPEIYLQLFHRRSRDTGRPATTKTRHNAGIPLVWQNSGQNRCGRGKGTSCKTKI